MHNNYGQITSETNVSQYITVLTINQQIEGFFLTAVTRNISLLTAMCDIVLKIQHINGRHNTVFTKFEQDCLKQFDYWYGVAGCAKQTFLVDYSIQAPGVMTTDILLRAI